MRIFLLVLMVLFLTGCGEVFIKQPCPKIKTVNVAFTINKQGGLNKSERIKALGIIEYYTYETERTNKVIDEMLK